MKKIRIYADTSVVGGCFDPEFKEWSNGLLLDFQRGVFQLILSVLVDAEIQGAPDEVKKIYIKFRQSAVEIAELTLESIELANAYIEHKILSPNFINDARHIAIATVSNADLLVSWNFHHVVNFEKTLKFNAVNMEMGYKPILIYSPMEVTKHGSEGS
jgi:hypothetical protein